jgi:putative ABC transport system ATP-binding protein
MNESIGPDWAVRTEDVWKIYPQEPSPVEAVRSFSLAIERGDFVAMAGPSGSGKTTVLNLLGGLTQPTRGRIWIGGEETTAMNARALARLRLEHIGFVFQAYNLLPVLTALENAEFTLLLRGIPAAERRRRIEHLFGEMGLGGWRIGVLPSSPAASSNAWHSPARSRANPRSSWPTSPPRTSTRPRRRPSWRSCNT